MRFSILKRIKQLTSGPCVIALLFSCGKKIESSDDTEVVTRAPARASVIDLEIETENNNRGSQEITTKADGWARIPARPTMIDSISNLVYSRISFHLANAEKLIQNTKLVCDYLSIKKSAPEKNEEAYNHQFLGCKEDIDGDGVPDDMNYVPGDEVAIEKNQVIEFEVHTSDTTDQLSIKSQIEVDWR